MENTLYIALSRQMVIKRQLGLIANNMANGLTPGYKGERMMFVEHLTKPEGGNRFDRMSFVRDLAVARDFQEGSFSDTSNELDFAIHGPGWFVIETNDGNRYTRNGHFRLDAEGQLVTTAGHRVLDVDGRPISFDPETNGIKVRADGSLLVDDEEQGRLQIAAFPNEQLLRKVSGNLYRTDAIPAPAENASVLQGKIEKSNVQPIIEMTKMINALRSYQGAQKIIENEHERLRSAIDKLTRDR